MKNWFLSHKRRRLPTLCFLTAWIRKTGSLWPWLVLMGGGGGGDWDTRCGSHGCKHACEGVCSAQHNTPIGTACMLKTNADRPHARTCSDYTKRKHKSRESRQSVLEKGTRRCFWEGENVTLWKQTGCRSSESACVTLFRKTTAESGGRRWYRFSHKIMSLRPAKIILHGKVIQNEIIT